MGYYWQGLPPFVLDWAEALLPKGSVSVETGTFEGDTTALLADRFGRCTSIERSDALYAAAAARFAGDDRVTLLHGSSRERLREALPVRDTGCFAWLDAHGFYDYTGPDSDENPLLAEIEVIAEERPDSPTVIAVDDARGMGTQPDWPPLHQILGSLDRAGYQSVIVDDCLVAAPRSVEPDFWSLYQASRMVEVPALFHVWSSVRRIVGRRNWTDRAVIRAQKLRGR